MTVTARDFVDLDRYPVDAPETDAGRALLNDCRQQLATRGACLLEAFVPETRMQALVDAADALTGQAHRNANCTTTPYQQTVSVSDDPHPRKRARSTSTHVIAYDLIPSQNGIRLLYEWDVLLQFIARVLGEAELYRYDDTLAALNIAANFEGDHNGWHFDQCDFVTSLLIREAESGGKFQFVPNLRSAEDENYPGVAQVLDGDQSSVITLPFTAGSLAIFKGRHAMHRVTTAHGQHPRLVALLGYDTKPGVVMDERSRLRRFGRTH